MSVFRPSDIPKEQRRFRPYIIIGQECICPDGLGRVVAVVNRCIHVQTYIKNMDRQWAPHNVQLIDPINNDAYFYHDPTDRN